MSEWEVVWVAERRHVEGAAGASAPDAESLAALDCVADGVRGWAMPDPGSYAAKVTFELR